MDFSNTYKTYSVSQLLRILAHAADYQPAAVEAAKAELAARRPSDQEIEDARQELAAEEQQHRTKEESTRLKQELFKQKSQTIVDSLDLTHAGEHLPDRLINITSFGLTLFIFVALIVALTSNPFSFHMAFHSLDGFLFFFALYLLPLIYLGIAVYQFYKRRRTGWVLLTTAMAFYGIFMFAGVISSFFLFYNIFTLYFATYSLVNLLKIFFFFGIVYLVCRKDIRQKFGVTPRLMKESLACSLLAALLVFSVLISVI